MIDLEAEMTAAGKAVRQPHLDRLRVFGVSNATIAEAGMSHWPFGVAAAEPLGNGLYQPGEGQLHIVLPVVEDWTLIDLMAFRPSVPGDWLLRTGNGFALGLEEGLGVWTAYLPADPAAVPPRYQVGSPLHLFSDPLDWVRGGRQGVCVVDWGSPDIRRLAGLPVVTVSDHATGKLLRQALTRPVQFPKIEIMGVAHAA
jgi:hypothetical protein